MVAVAELEAGLVSERTKAALAAAKRKGTRLGNPKLAEASASGVWSIRRNADAFAKQVLPVIRDVQQSGARSLRAIARALEVRGIPTARGGQWTPVQVSAVLRRSS
jgi:DNA invertase Pin-like site-specific DNA recombinase